jgi:hypothetical protein
VVLYDRLELLAPTREPELLADLAERTGQPVQRASVNRVDLLRDTAELTVVVRAGSSRHER